MRYHWGLGVGHLYTRMSGLNTQISATADQLINEHTGDLRSIIDSDMCSGLLQPPPGPPPNVHEPTLDRGVETTTRLRCPHQLEGMAGGPSTTLNPECVDAARNLDLSMQEANGNVSHIVEIDCRGGDLGRGDEPHDEQRGDLRTTLGALQRSAAELEVPLASTAPESSLRLPHQEANTFENAEIHASDANQTDIEIEGDHTGRNLAGDSEDFELGRGNDIELGDDSDSEPSVAYNANTFDAPGEDLGFLEDMYGDDMLYDTDVFSYD